MALHRYDVSIFGRVPPFPRLASGLGRLGTSHQLLDFSHRKSLVDRALCELGTLRVPDQGSRMAHVEAARLQMRDYRGRQGEQAQEVRDMAAGLADKLADFRLRHVLELRQSFIRSGFLDRVEIFTLDILNERESGDFALVKLAN